MMANLALSLSNKKSAKKQKLYFWQIESQVLEKHGEKKKKGIDFTCPSFELLGHSVYFSFVLYFPFSSVSAPRHFLES